MQFVPIPDPAAPGRLPASSSAPAPFTGSGPSSHAGFAEVLVALLETVSPRGPDGAASDTELEIADEPTIADDSDPDAQELVSDEPDIATEDESVDTEGPMNALVHGPVLTAQDTSATLPAGERAIERVDAVVQSAAARAHNPLILDDLDAAFRAERSRTPFVSSGDAPVSPDDSGPPRSAHRVQGQVVVLSNGDTYPRGIRVLHQPSDDLVLTRSVLPDFASGNELETVETGPAPRRSPLVNLLQSETVARNASVTPRHSDTVLLRVPPEHVEIPVQGSLSAPNRGTQASQTRDDGVKALVNPLVQSTATTEAPTEVVDTGHRVRNPVRFDVSGVRRVGVRQSRPLVETLVQVLGSRVETDGEARTAVVPGSRSEPALSFRSEPAAPTSAFERAGVHPVNPQAASPLAADHRSRDFPLFRLRVDAGGETQRPESGHPQVTQLESASSTTLGWRTAWRDGDSAGIPRVPAVMLENVVVRGVQWLASTPESDSIVVRLQPESLGELRIHIRTSDDGLDVAIAASSLRVRETLEGHLPGLRDALARDGFDAPRVTVVTGDASGASDGRYPGRHPQSAGSSWTPRAHTAPPDRPPIVAGLVSHSRRAAHGGTLDVIV